MSFSKTAFPIDFDEPDQLVEYNYTLDHTFAPPQIVATKNNDFVTIPTVKFAPAFHFHYSLNNGSNLVSIATGNIWIRHLAGYLLVDVSGWIQLRGVNIQCYDETIYCGAVVESSSRALKEDIQDLPEDLDLVKKVKPRKYKKNGKETFGFILEDCPPEWVFRDTDSEGKPASGIRAWAAIASLWRAVQSILGRLDILEKKVKP